jgi:hypothetical protein
VPRERLKQLSVALRTNGYAAPFGFWWTDRIRIGLLVAPAPDHEAEVRQRANEILTDAAWSKKVVAL